MFSKELYKKYRFKFVGLKSEDRKDELDRLDKEIRTYKTVNEVRKEMGYKEREGEDIILDPIWMEWYMQMSPAGQEFQKQQAEQMQGMEAGAEGEMGSDAVQYVDEDGNPLNPEDIDPNTMRFEDEEGNAVDHEGNPQGDQQQQQPLAAQSGLASIQQQTLPFEEEKLPFEEGYEEKLPFE